MRIDLVHIKTIFLPILLGIIPCHLTAETYDDFPPPSCVEYQDFTLTICTPDPLPDPPESLIGYNIYANDVFIVNIPLSPPFDTVIYAFDETQLVPGGNDFCVKAIYTQWISEPLCDHDTVVYGFELPLTEDWSSLNFSTNSWTAEGNNWIILDNEGNPAPAVAFQGQPALSNYSRELTSHYFLNEWIPLKESFIRFDLKLESLAPTGDELLLAEAWDWISGTWLSLDTFTNAEGSFDWKTEKRKLTGTGTCLRVRFRATGSSSSAIDAWYIDNIYITGECQTHSELSIHYLHPDWERLLQWQPPLGIFYEEWKRWCNTNNYTAIGSGSTIQFQVAARWTPGQLNNCNMKLHAVRFFPYEENAQYIVKAWQGSPPQQVYQQNVPNPAIGQWNTVELNPPLSIDTSKDLMVGYYVSTTTGFPAGVDHGPAIDGFGNMFYLSGEWQTLLEIDPDLDYNWSIEALLKCSSPYTPYYSHTNIYRAGLPPDTNFQKIDETTNYNWYLDETALAWEEYCYRVTAVWNLDGNTCESPYSDMNCDPIYLDLSEIDDESLIRIYPNPADDLLVISSDKEMKYLEMYNSMGIPVFQSKYPGKKLTITVKQFPSGMYFLRIDSGAGEYSGKVLIVN
jgi:hypothetical protein